MNLLSDLSVNSRFVKKKKNYFYLEISDYISLRAYYENVSFVINRKYTKLFQGLGSYKRGTLRKYSKDFKLKALNLLEEGLSVYRVGKILDFPHPNIYDFVRQKERGDF